jgi:hypothetical protein
MTGLAVLTTTITYQGDEYSADKIIDIRKPKVRIEDLTPLNMIEGESATIFVKTTNPTGTKVIDVSKVDIKIVDPDNKVIEDDMSFAKTGEFEYDFKFAKPGIYYFTYTPFIPNYEIVPKESSTEVFEREGIPLFWYVMFGGLGLLIILIIRKQFFVKSKRSSRRKR